MNNMYNLYFTTYELGDPPTIVPKDTVLVEPIVLFKQPEDMIPDDLKLINYNNWLSKYPEIEAPEENLEMPYNTEIQHNNILKEVVNTASKFIGTKYSYGGQSPSTGFDCSGLIRYAYKLNGINIPRTVALIEKYGIEVPSLLEVRVGDIVCSKGHGPSGKHAKLITKIEDGKIYTIEAKGKRFGIVEAILDPSEPYTTIRRVVTDNIWEANAFGNASIDRHPKKLDYFHRFKTKDFDEFVKVMYPIVEESLIEHGYNTSQIDNIIKLMANESDYGTTPRGSRGYNLGGIKWFPEAHKGRDKTLRPDTEDEYYIDFENLKDYVDYHVKLLNNTYNALNATSTLDFINRLHGQNAQHKKYSDSYEKYKTALFGMSSLLKAINRYKINNYVVKRK